MIDPVQSLAFAVQTHPGIYALLLGSGVSRSAGIPTGWEIVLDLIRKLGVANQELVEPDPEQWYIEKFGTEPNYSEILDRLAKTSTERQLLLRPYFEPTIQEREEGLKQPTAAHKSIAYLARQGFFRVIITTNFDRLMEKALEEEGISPEVISSPEQLKGSLPLTHVQCRLLKIHGDYLDPGIRNTPSELSNYPEIVDDQLDRILDEFGLIVCGWSADWDIALRDAISRTAARRFTTYWATRGEPTDAAQRLMDQRRAEIVPISGADDFFQKLQETVESLVEFSRPHPLSTEAAVASLKRYLPSPEHRIRFEDLIDSTVEQLVVEQLVNVSSGQDFDIEGSPAPSKGMVSERLRRYEFACTTLLAMAPTGGFWAEDYHYHVWERTLQRLGTAPPAKRFHPAWIAVAQHPARMLLYTLGLGAVASGRLHFLNRLFKTPVEDKLAPDGAVPILTSLFGVEQTTRRNWDQFLEGMDNRISPMNDWIHDALRDHLRSRIPNDDIYTFTFDKLETLIALGYAHLDRTGRNTWFPPGAYLHRSQNRERILQEFETSLSETGANSPLVQSGIFGDSADQCKDALTKFAARLPAIYAPRQFIY